MLSGQTHHRPKP